jgi:cell division protein FtsN
VATAPPKTKRKRPSTGNATRRSNPSKKQGPSNTPLFNGSHVSGFIVGLLVGVIASLGIVGGVNPSALPQAVKTVASDSKDDDRQPSFTFFTTLVDESISVSAAREPTPSESKYTQYVLQAGSFRASTDADRRRGELALLGLEAAVEEISTDTGSWHRVYIGPFDSRSAMAKARSLTAQSDIDTLLLKRSQ